MLKTYKITLSIRIMFRIKSKCNKFQFSCFKYKSQIQYSISNNLIDTFSILNEVYYWYLLITIDTKDTLTLDLHTKILINPQKKVIHCKLSSTTGAINDSKISQVFSQHAHMNCWKFAAVPENRPGYRTNRITGIFTSADCKST